MSKKTIQDKAMPHQLHGQLDTSFQTMQRDLFASGMVAQIGVNAFAIWQAIKAHADYQTGVCWPSIRRLMELTGLASATVQKALETLTEARLLRITKQGRRNNYVACERMDFRLGDILICTVIVDYVPAQLRETLPRIKSALEGKASDAKEIMAQIEIIPGPGFAWDNTSGSLRQEMSSRTLATAMLGKDRAQEVDAGFTEQIRNIQARAIAKRGGLVPVDNSEIVSGGGTS
jgi:hypothetical protein